MIILDKNINWDWENIFGKLKEVENLPMDWEWEVLEEHYNGNFTEYIVSIGNYVYGVDLFYYHDMKTDKILYQVMEHLYLQSLEEYQKEKEERENSIKNGRGGWEF